MEISNTSRKADLVFLLRIVVLAAVMLAIWIAVLQLLPHRRHPIVPDQWTGNRVIAEKFLLSSKRDDVVLVGSSVTNHLPEAQLGAGITNLGFVALNAMSGLEVIRAHRPLPSMVAIEINFIYRHDDGAFTATVLNSVRMWTQREFPVARTENQPLTVLLSAFRHDQADGMATAARNNREIAAQQKVRESEVARNMIEMSAELPTTDLNNSLTHLEAIVRELRDDGVRFAFYELPMDPRLMDTPRMRQVLRAVRTRFDPTEWHWVILPGDEGSDTVDGIHLGPAAAAHIATRLRSELAALQ